MFDASNSSFIFYFSGEVCCDRLFSNSVCHRDDICTGETSTSGFYPVFKWPGCTNDDKAPDYMKGETSFFFQDIESCCSSSNFDMADYKLCLEKSVDVGPMTTTSSSQSSSTSASQAASPDQTTTTTTSPSSLPPGDCDKQWHISTTGAKDTCTNDGSYPDSWNMPQLAKSQLFETADACCQKHFASKPVCNKINTCPPDEDSSSSNEPPDEDSSSSNEETDTTPPPGDCDKSWHISTTGEKDTCINDDNYPESWNMPQLAKLNLFESADACCQKYFASRPVCNQINTCPPDESTSSNDPNESPGEDSSSSNEPPDESSPSNEETDTTPPPGDCDKSWHISTTGEKDTCINDDNYPESWNMPQLAKLNLFESADACCQKYFASRPVCNQINTCPPDESSPSNEETETSTSVAATTETTTTSSSTTSSLNDEKNTLALDWEDETIPDIVKFEGTGKWRIDATQPCCRTGVAIHNQNLLPGEQTSMIIDYTVPPGGGEITFDYNMGLGSFDFLINDQLEVRLAVPGGGLKTFGKKLEAGDYKFTWKYGAPPIANLPLSAVWIDNINIG